MRTSDEITWAGLLDGALGSFAGAFFGGLLALVTALLIYRAGERARRRERIQEGLTEVAEACDEYVASWNETERVRRRIYGVKAGQFDDAIRDIKREKANLALRAAKVERQDSYKVAQRAFARVLPLTVAKEPDLHKALESTWHRVRDGQHLPISAEAATSVAEISRHWIADPDSAQQHREIAQRITSEGKPQPEVGT